MHIYLKTYANVIMHIYTLRKYAHVNIYIYIQTYVFIIIEINSSIIIYKNVYEYRLLSYGTIVSTKFYFHVKAFFWSDNVRPCYGS